LIGVASFLLQMLNPTLLLELSKLQSSKVMLALDYWAVRDPVCTMFLFCPVSSTTLLCPCPESPFFYTQNKIFSIIFFSFIEPDNCTKVLVLIKVHL